MIGTIVAYGGGAAAIAFAVFQFLGKSWLENFFRERLEFYKHQQALELQRLRVEIDSTLSAALKLQEREFALLPEAWTKLDHAHGQVAWLVSPLQQFPALDRLHPKELEEFLASTELTESQKSRVRDADRKVNAYEAIVFWARLHQVKVSVADLRDYVSRNGIFFPASLKEKFDSLVSTYWAVLTSKEVGVEAEDYKMQSEAWSRLEAQATPVRQEIGAAIQARLRSHGPDTRSP